MSNISSTEYEAALKAIETEAVTPEEKAEMLMEIAMGLQQKPKTVREIEEAVALYQHALELCPATAPALRARIQAWQGTAYQALPNGGASALDKAQECFEQALQALKIIGTPEEIAEVEMNLGLTLQALASNGAARIQDALQSYHRALLTFTRKAYPQEFAILHNNLAIAYLSIPMSDERAKMREALQDRVVYGVLLHHGLVKEPLQLRLETALAQVRPMLHGHGGDVEVVAVKPPDTVEIRLVGACHGCPASA